MVTARDWDDLFCKQSRLVPPDERGTWNLIAECLGDNDALTHTFNAVLKSHGVPRHEYEKRDDCLQDLAARLADEIRRCPSLNLHHQVPGASAAAWFYGVIGNLCDELQREKWGKDRPHSSLDVAEVEVETEESAGGNPGEVLSQLLADARERQRLIDDAEDAVLDVREFLTVCDEWTRRVLLVYLTDLRVRTVAQELGLSYPTAWRAVNMAETQLREWMSDYRLSSGGHANTRIENSFRN